MAAAAQSSLEALDKQKAPIAEQVEQAAIFAGRGEHLHHGREEWTLRWALKKFNSVGDLGVEARACKEIWTLLGRLVQSIEVTNTARVLTEFNFINGLALALKELRDTDECGKHAQSTSSKSSKKRRRDGSPVQQNKTRDVKGLRNAIGGTIQTLFDKSSNVTKSLDMEHIQSVLRSSPDIAAGIFGEWMASSDTISHNDDFLLSFLQVWQLRSKTPSDADVFANKCLEPLLKTLQSNSISEDVRAQLQEALSRAIINPARREYSISQDPALLKRLLNQAVSRGIQSANMVFTIIIRCVVVQANRRRKAYDNDWLQAVFTTLLEIVESSEQEGAIVVITTLLQTCVGHDVRPGSKLLQNLVTKTAYASTSEYWEFIKVVLQRDSHVFLDDDEEEESSGLVSALIEHISQASTTDKWITIADLVIDGVLVPLMVEFSKARQLPSFVDLWVKALSVLGSQEHSMNSKYCMAWEDEALQTKFKELMEPALSTSQIMELVDKTTSTVHVGSYHGLLVVVDAIAGAVSKEDTMDAIGLRLCQFAQSCKEQYGIEVTSRSTTHLWRCVTRTFQWRTPAIISSGEWVVERATVLELMLGEICARYSSETVVDYYSGAIELFRATSTVLSLQESVGTKDPSVTRTFFDRLLPHFLICVNKTLEFIQSSKDHDNPVLYDSISWRARRLHRGAVKAEDGCAYVCDLAELILVQNAGWHILSSRDTIVAAINLALVHDGPFEGKGIAEVFQMLLRLMLRNQEVENNTTLIGVIIESLLETCDASSAKQPSPFVVSMLYDLPIEAFSRQQRAKIYEWDNMSPNVASLKMKMLRGAVVFNCVEDLVALGHDTIASTPGLPLYSHMVRTVMENAMSTIDQEKSQSYIKHAVDFITSWLKANKKPEKPLPATMIATIDAFLAVCKVRIDLLVANETLTQHQLEKIEKRHATALTANMQYLLKSPKELDKAVSEHSLSCYSTILALSSVDHEHSDVLDAIAHSSHPTANGDLMAEMKVYIAKYTEKDSVDSDEMTANQVSSMKGRLVTEKVVTTIMARRDRGDRLKYVEGLLSSPEQHATDLGTLLSGRYAIMACDDSTGASTERDNTAFDLSSVYSILAESLPLTSSFRRFCLISETMDLILRTKTHCISQQNIDTTISSIDTICSAAGSQLSGKRAGSIFLHVTTILRTILLSHRLKIQGHLNTIPQVLNVLLFRLYTPVSVTPSINRTLPSWSTSNSHPLTLIHAQAYTRLLTLLCDPSISSVSRSSTNQLNPATAKAKRSVSLHVPLVVSAFISCQLNGGLKISSQVVEELTRGIWAIFDVMSVQGRRVLGESLAASGRAVLSELIKDWTRFGKWKGL